MFEKEAEEIEKEAIKWVKDVFPNDEFKQSGISRALVEFAELGYNKAFVEADKNLKAIVADFNKAKELIKEMLSILPKENIEGIYEITEEAEQFIREVEE